MRRIQVPDEQAGSRLDVFLAGATGLSRARAGSLIDEGRVMVDGVSQRKAYRLTGSEVLEVGAAEETRPAAPSGVEVVFEDADLLVVSKPSGVVVHGAPGLREGTLVDALEAGGRELARTAGEGRAGIVHRLDRDVSGLLIVAKTDDAHARLVAEMKARRIERRYLALVDGIPSSDRGKIDAPIGRHPRHRTRMAVLSDGRPAVTWFSVRERFGPTTLLEVRLETGRTHQIRTHLASIGLPIVGDRAYGRDPAVARRLDLRRPFLHAYRLAFGHPLTGEPLSFESPLPDELRSVVESLRRAALTERRSAGKDRRA
jgi:23S rRNA pseudouridine1911/1915/1917 synthase